MVTVNFGVKAVVSYSFLLLKFNYSTITHMQYQLMPQPPPPVKYIGVNDQLILEDQVQRVTLCGNISTSDFVTGIVMGVYGRELRNGCFEVEDHCFAKMPEQEENVAMETEEEAK